ncbi:PCI domain-containing protein [Ditylenchus destructor]|uniref:PCI domain-containing protein n=1 Tax=Ditylenchus destructor TaxID=166010 RepID=A0AAD4NDX9_9BILA|nr:PCI domain-containing protein [Ditylenchus destructor]
MNLIQLMARREKTPDEDEYMELGKPVTPIEKCEEVKKAECERKQYEELIVKYCQPFLNIDMSAMATDLGVPLEQLENDLVMLIENGTLKARIDSLKKIVYPKNTSDRLEIYRKYAEILDDFKKRTYMILLRAALQNHLLSSSP